MVDESGGGDLAMTAAGFNPSHPLDALAALDAPYVHFAFTAPESRA